MRAALNKYRHIFLLGLQNNLVYRWNFLIRGAMSLVHLCVVFILWGAAYAGVTHIGGFTVQQTITYFVLLLVLEFFIGAFNEDYQIGEDIRNGLINQFLLKPVNYYGYRLSLFTAARAVSGLLVLVPLALALPLIHSMLIAPAGLWRLWLGLPALACSAVLQFTIAYCFGLLAFWFLEIQGFVILSYAIETLLGGQLFPLDLLPAPLYHATQFLPFFYQAYFPAAILSGRMDFASAAGGLAVQVVWVLLLLALARVLWRCGLRKHTAVGG